MIGLLACILAAGNLRLLAGTWATGALESGAVEGVQASIARPVGEWREVGRTFLSTQAGTLPGRLPKMVLFAHSFEAIDSQIARSGSEFSVIFYVPNRTEPPAKIRTSDLLLIVTKKADQNGKLEFNGGSSAFSGSTCFVADDRSELAGELLMSTPARCLPKSDSEYDIVTGAILDTPIPGDDSSYAQAARLLGTAHPQWKLRPNVLSKFDREVSLSRYSQTDEVPFCEEGFSTARLRSALQRAKNIYEQSRILELMARWRVPNSMKPYIACLMGMIDQPAPYSQEEIREPFWGPVPHLADDFSGLDGQLDIFLPANIDKLVNAKNVALLKYWLHEFGGVKNKEDYPRFANLLDFPDRECRFEVACFFADHLKDPAHKPRAGVAVNGVWVPYPDLDEAVAYWKSYFAAGRANYASAGPAPTMRTRRVLPEQG